MKHPLPFGQKRMHELLDYARTEALEKLCPPEGRSESAIVDTGDVRALALREAIERGGEERTRAMRELSSLLRKAFWPACTKDAHSEVYSLCAAMMRQYRDAGLPLARQKEAAKELAFSVEATFPRKKRLEALQLHRRALQLHKRGPKRQPLRSHSDADSQSSWANELPTDVLRKIMFELDPPALATASCVCSSWYSVVVSDNRLWQLHCISTFGARRANRRMSFTTKGSDWRSTFLKLCKHHPSYIGDGSNRVLCTRCNTLLWQIDGQMERKRRRCRHRLQPCTPSEAIDAFLRSCREDRSSGSDSDSDSGDGSQ